MGIMAMLMKAPAAGGGGGGYDSSVTSEANLLSYWKLDEAAGATSFADSVGTNTMALTGAATAGVAGNTSDGATALSFTATSGTSSGFIRAASVPTLANTNSWAVEFWLNFTAPGATFEGLMQYGTFGQVYINGSSNTFVQTDGTNFHNLADVTAAVWHHVCLNQVGPGGAELDLYVDGSRVGFCSNSPGAAAFGLTLGQTATTGTNKRLVGTIQKVAFYGANLTAARILAHYNAR